jgi:hypothetical protein
LLLILFVSKLAELVSSDEVLVNMANPSMTRGTAFFRDVPAVVLQPAAVVQFLLARAVTVGAGTYLDAPGLKARSATVPLRVTGRSNRALSPLSLLCQLLKEKPTYMSRYRVSDILQRARKLEKSYGKKQ